MTKEVRDWRVDSRVENVVTKFGYHVLKGRFKRLVLQVTNTSFGEWCLGSGNRVTNMSFGEGCLGSGNRVTNMSFGEWCLGSGNRVTIMSFGEWCLGSGNRVTNMSFGEWCLGSGNRVTNMSFGEWCLGSGNGVTNMSFGEWCLGSGNRVTNMSFGEWCLGSGNRVTKCGYHALRTHHYHKAKFRDQDYCRGHHTKLVSDDKRKTSVMMGTLLCPFSSCACDSELTEEMWIPLRPTPREDTSSLTFL